MLIYTHQRSKKRKPTAKQRQLQAEWEELVNRTKLNNKVNNVKPLVNNNRYIRETEYYPSKDTGYYNTFKKADLYYTGDNMKGIGTLHKSNAVPIFTDEEAKDQAKMRR